MNSNHVSYLEDDWENFNRGAQNRSNLFNKQVQILDYSNRNLKFKNDSLASEPSYKEINYRKTMNKPQKNTMPNFTFMDQINEISHFSSRFHKGDHPFFQSSRLPFGGIKTTSKEIWKKGFFKILVLIFRFKSNLKRKTFKYILRSLKPNQLEMIGDNAFFLESYQNISKVLWEKKLEKLALDKSKNIGLRSRLSNRTSLKKIESKKDKFKSFCLKMAKILVISVAYFLKLISYLKPNLKTRIFWDITLIIILLTQMWYIPVFSSFEIALEAPGLRIYFQTIPLIIFSIDIFFNFVTGYYSKGLWVTEKRRIARHYLKKEFWIDIFTLVPLFLSYLNVATNQWAFCFMLRVVRISKMVRKIEDHFQLQVNYSSILSLGKLATTLIFIVHVFACMWNLLARIEVFFNSNSHTWLAEKEIDNENWVIKYMAAFYYTLVTSVTVGYGDIVPQNSVERLFSCLIILFGCGQNAYSINSIGSIFQDMFREETALKQQIASLTAYMNKRSVDSSLQIKARRYLEYVNRQEKLAYQKGESILSSLSFSLRDEILKNIYGKTFKNDISFLGENFSEVFIESLMLRAREVSYAPEELIYRKNENDDLSLFFITKGKVEIYLDFRQKFLQMTHLGQGRSFGEKEFILGDARNFSARSLECTRLIYVKRKEFLDVLESFPEDQERFLMLKDRLLHNVGVSVNEVCYFCDNKTHNLAKCPLISYQPEKNLVVDKFLNNFEQKRARFKRRKFFKFCSLKIKNEISHYAENFYEGRKGDRELYEAQVGILEEELEERKINEEIHESKIFNSRSIQIDKGKNFKNYFPSDNLDRFISNLTSRNQILPKINRQKNKSTNPKRGFNKNIQVESEIRRTSSYQKASQMIGKGYLWIKNKLLKH